MVGSKASERSPLFVAGIVIGSSMVSEEARKDNLDSVNLSRSSLACPSYCSRILVSGGR